MPRQDRLARYLLAAFLLVLVLAPIVSGGVDLLVDWLWFRQEGYRVLFTTVLKAQIALSGMAGLGFMAVVGANLLVARGLGHRYGYRVYDEIVEFPALDRFSSAFRWLIWVGVLLVGYMIGQWGSAHWFEYLLAQHGLTLGQGDPLYGIDLGFYLFQLPFRWFLFYWALLTVLGCLLSAVFYYLVKGGIWVTPRGPSIAPQVRAHLMVLGALLGLLAAYRFRLGMYDLLFSPRGIVYGAGYADVHASLPVLWVLIFLSLVTAAMLLAGAALGRIRPAVVALLALVVVGLIGGKVYPEILQQLVVKPNEIEKEQPYIKRAIEFTRRAYALDRFEEREFSAVEDLTPGDIRSNQATIRNVRLWDHKPLLTTFAQLQEIRTYYGFEHVDNDRYWIDGTYRQVSLSPRELASASLPSRSWINEHLTYTHGYGLCLGPVNELSNEGLPEFFIRDIPPVANASIRITRPEIYFGELTTGYCFVKTAQQEFDYPKGREDVYTTYQGASGIPVENLWRRLLFTLKFGEINVLFSSAIGPQSEVMIYRQVLSRVSRLTPFLRYDGDPYLVIAQDGTLYWMLDGYATSENYPYSDPTAGVGNYIRNSVKATMNAYTGRVRFYVSDAADPLIQAYRQIFPGVFEPLEQMPPDLLAHIRYPEDFFTIQARKYSVFHMTDPRVFYNKEDLWRVTQSATQGAASPMNPYYTIMKLAEVGRKEEFILMVPFTPARKDNMIAWMAARCDEPNYGKVLVFTFPKQKLVYGPQQIESRIDQDPTISQQLTLWGQGGSKVIRGTLLVIPILQSVLYVEPLYLAAEAGGGLPQLKRILVAYADHVVMEPTLDAALSKIFGGGVSTGAPAPPGAPQVAPARAAATGQPELPALIREANQHFERAQELLRRGDWAGYGEEMRRLGEVLKRMPAAAPAPAPK